MENEYPFLLENVLTVFVCIVMSVHIMNTLEIVALFHWSHSAMLKLASQHGITREQGDVRPHWVT